MERIAAADRIGIAVLAGLTRVGLVEPDPAGGIDGVDLEFEHPAIGRDDGAMNADLGRVDTFRHHPHRAPLPGALERGAQRIGMVTGLRSEEHTHELHSLIRTSYALL